MALKCLRESVEKFLGVNDLALSHVSCLSGVAWL